MVCGNQKIIVILLLLAGVFLSGSEIVLDNGLLQAHIAEPGSGYYAGARFETEGFVVKLIRGNNNYFGWNYQGIRSPDEADQISGQAEEFEKIWLKPEKIFLKIGNGVFQVPLGEKHWANGKYPCSRRFQWDMVRRNGEILFRQNSGNLDGYAYEYEKCIRLVPGKPVLEISYRLRNTGKKRIQTTQYAHNFIALNGSIPPGTLLRYPGKFHIMPKRPQPPYTKQGTDLLFGKLKISFSRVYPEFTANWSVITFPDGEKLCVKEAYIPCRLALYTGTNHICPESFIPIDLSTGKIMEWKRSYHILTP